MTSVNLPLMYRSSALGCIGLLWTMALSGACGRVPLDLAGDEPATMPNPSAGTGGSSVAGASGTAGTGGTSGGKCPGTKCGIGQVCCILDGTCISPSRAATDCPQPTTLPAYSLPGSVSCGSNADCKASEFCGSTTACLGPGQCMDRANCGTSTGPPFCGCDGVMYKDVQTACRAGVTTLAHLGACGVLNPPGGDDGSRKPETFCGNDAQCPSGQTCCARYGTCLDPSVSYLCSPPPPGTRAPCLEDLDCRAAEFCQGDGCSGPGGCVGGGNGLCSGVLEPVCGCDGHTYTNEDCTVAAGVRTLHTGPCETP
jgi:hypothetical protein